MCVIPSEGNVGPQHGDVWDTEGIAPAILNLNNSWGKKMPVPGQGAESDPKLA